MSPALFDVEEKTLAEIGVKGGNPLAVAVMCEQEGSVWFGARAGIPTASNAALIVTSKGEPAKGQSRQSYLHSLVAERLLGATEMGHSNAAMERGTNLEPRARAWYQFQSGESVLTGFEKPNVSGLFQRVGFIYRDKDKRCGCSPDGLTETRMPEIKCPMHKGMIGTLINGKVPTTYIPQIQMQLWVCGMDVADFVMYTPEPEIRSVIWPVEKDDKVHAALTEHVARFCAELDAAEKQMRDMLA